MSIKTTITWPTKPGWYWMRDWSEDVERVAIAEAHRAPAGITVVCKGEIIYRTPGIEFAGPLYPPEHWSRKL